MIENDGEVGRMGTATYWKSPYLEWRSSLPGKRVRGEVPSDDVPDDEDQGCITICPNGQLKAVGYL